jgi:hypothetical protein
MHTIGNKSPCLGSGRGGTYDGHCRILQWIRCPAAVAKDSLRVD